MERSREVVYCISGEKWSVFRIWCGCYNRQLCLFVIGSQNYRERELPDRVLDKSEIYKLSWEESCYVGIF